MDCTCAAVQFQKDSGALSSHGVHEDARMNSEPPIPRDISRMYICPLESFIFKRGWDIAKTRGSVQSKKMGSEARGIKE